MQTRTIAITLTMAMVVVVHGGDENRYKIQRIGGGVLGDLEPIVLVRQRPRSPKDTSEILSMPNLRGVATPAGLEPAEARLRFASRPPTNPTSLRSSGSTPI